MAILLIEFNANIQIIYELLNFHLIETVRMFDLMFRTTLTTYSYTHTHNINNDLKSAISRSVMIKYLLFLQNT